MRINSVFTQTKAFSKLIILSLLLLMLTNIAKAENVVTSDAKEQLQIKIDAMPLADALKKVASLFGKQIVFFSEITEGQETKSLSGSFTEQQAIESLLEGTKLSYSYVNDRTISIKKTDEQSKITPTTNDADSKLDPQNEVKTESIDESTLETIIVTARKTSENLQSVPISIATIDSENLHAMFDGGEDIRALAGRIPSVYAEGSSGRTAPRFYIRGLGNVDFDLTASQPVSIIMDDVVMENVLLKGFPLFDIQQVEVLRGPQGTLFGRNTPAGIIKFETVKPSEEFEGSMSASVGSFGAQIYSFGVGGALSDTVSVRVAAQINRRSDWINNANDDAAFVSSGDDLGGHNEKAARMHLLYQPNEDFQSLLTLQSRSLKGTTSIFRANILDVGSNELNDRFDRDTVYYDGGRNNTSEVKTSGSTLKLEYDFGGYSLTSITSHFTGSSNGINDVDGGAGVGATANTGFIPFPSETGSLDSDLSQTTQELRLSSNQNTELGWQFGLFYFDDEFTVDSAAWNGFGNPDPTIIAITTQSSRAWALFGQVNYELSDKLGVTAGLRYSNDEKEFVGTRPLGFLGPINAFEKESDEHLSWDISTNYDLDEDVMVYARLANAYRAPSIQGRLLFTNSSTTAKSEVANSLDIGIKSLLLDDRLRLNTSTYYYEIDDQQFTAIGGAGNFNQLINANKGVGKGIEIDATYLLTDNLLITMGASINHTEIKDKDLLVSSCTGGCTVTDPIVLVDGRTRALIDGNSFPQAPEWIYSISASYTVPMNGDAELFFFTDWSVQGKTNFFLYESEEFYSNKNYSGGVRVGYRDFQSGIEAALFVRNVTNEENLIGAIDFNNLTGFVNEPRLYGAEISYDF